MKKERHKNNASDTWMQKRPVYSTMPSTNRGAENNPQTSTPSSTNERTHIQQERERERTAQSTQTHTELSQLRSGMETSSGIQSTIKEWVRRGAEWVKEQFSGSSGNIAAVVVTMMDEVLERNKPDHEDEFGGVQNQEDVSRYVREQGVQAQLDANTFDHRKNTLPEFEQSLRSGKNPECDLRRRSNKIIVAHNRTEDGSNDVNFSDYLNVMKRYPQRKVALDIKDRGVVALLQRDINALPASEKSSVLSMIEVGTFDPEIVMQVSRWNNQIPVSLHFIPLMRYSNREHATNAVRAINQNKKTGWFKSIIQQLAPDRANDTLAGLEHAQLHTSYESYQNESTAQTANAPDHVLALWDPLMELPQEVINAVTQSNGYFSFPYDAKYLQHISQNRPRGIDMSRIALFNIKSHDDLHDALRFGVRRAAHNLERS